MLGFSALCLFSRWRGGRGFIKVWKCTYIIYGWSFRHRIVLIQREHHSVILQKVVEAKPTSFPKEPLRFIIGNELEKINGIEDFKEDCLKWVGCDLFSKTQVCFIYARKNLHWVTAVYLQFKKKNPGVLLE